MTEYNFQLYDPVGNFLSRLDDYNSADFVRSVNTVGTFKIELPPIGYSDSMFRRDCRIMVYRKPLGGAFYLEGRTMWLVRKITRRFVNGKWHTDLYAEDLLNLLKRRIVGYMGEVTYSWKTILGPVGWTGTEGYEDDLIKEFVRENLGDESTTLPVPGTIPDPDRDYSQFLSVEENFSQSATAQTEKKAEWLPLLQVVQDLARHSTQQGVPLFFDIESDINQNWTFKTYINQRGADRSSQGLNPITFSIERDNLVDVELDEDYNDEVTAVYVGGEDPGVGRQYTLVTDNARIAESPLNRIEAFVGYPNEEDTTILGGYGRVRLEEGRPRLRMRGRAVDTFQTRYGRDFHYGFLVQAEVLGNIFDCYISTVHIVVDDSGEQLDIRMDGEAII